MLTTTINSCAMVNLPWSMLSTECYRDIPSITME